MTTLRLSTIEGQIPMDDFEDDSGTIPITVPSNLTPDMLRLLADCTAATVERIASDLESIGAGRSVLKGTHELAGRVRSMQALRRAA